jgi:hypothetical protein
LVGHDFALIAIDSAAFLYQSSALNVFGCLTFLRSTPFGLSDWELGVLQSSFGEALFFATEK